MYLCRIKFEINCPKMLSSYKKHFYRLSKIHSTIFIYPGLRLFGRQLYTFGFGQQKEIDAIFLSPHALNSHYKIHTKETLFMKIVRYLVLKTRHMLRGIINLNFALCLTFLQSKNFMHNLSFQTKLCRKIERNQTKMQRENGCSSLG